MKSELVGQEKNRVEIKVEFEGAEFEAEVKKVFADISKRANVPGFRKGYVPRKTIEMRFGKATIYDEAAENLLNKYVPQIIEDYDLEPLMAPVVKSRDAIVEGNSVGITLVFENRPEINLPELGDIEVERLISVLGDSDVEEMVQNLRKSYATHEIVDEPVKENSIVTVEFTVSLSANNKPEKATISMEESPSPEFYNALLGKKVGDKVEVEIPNPNPEAKEENKNIRYSLNIVEVGKRILPELNPEFFEKAIGKSCANEEEFRDTIATQMMNRFQADAEKDAEARAIATLSVKSEFEAPALLIHREMQAIKAADERRGAKRDSTDEQAEYEKHIMLRAHSAVRSSLILDELGKKFEIKLDPSEFDEWIKERSKIDGVDPDIMHRVYYRDKDSLNMLADRIFTEKTIKELMKNVKIKEVSELTPVVKKED